MTLDLMNFEDRSRRILVRPDCTLPGRPEVFVVGDLIVSIGRVRSSGLFAWLMWLGVHLAALTGFKNRIAVLANWLIAFLSNARPQRAITAQQVFAREALEVQAMAITNAVPALSGEGFHKQGG